MVWHDCRVLLLSTALTLFRSELGAINHDQRIFYLCLEFANNLLTGGLTGIYTRMIGL